MSSPRADAVVVGHICLDMIPTFDRRVSSVDAIFSPGKLTAVGPMVTATGGAVSNTGLALHRLGIPTRLVGKIGNDAVGRAILDVLRGYHPDLAAGMIALDGEHSSYTVVISPPGLDRMFLHYPGANETFVAADVPADRLSEARLFHFGYPPIMRRMYAEGGGELHELLRRVKANGLTASLDMAMPDPESEAGRVDWPALLRRVLPAVDVFSPSVEEVLFLLDRDRFEDLRRQAGTNGVASRVDGPLLGELAARLLQMGTAIVLLKLGDQGLYLRTTRDAARLADLGGCAPANASIWRGRELLAPCFRVDVVGTTGAGDCTIAGLLAGLLQGRSPEEVITLAVAVGACSVETADAVSGVPPLAEVERRIRAGWPRLPVNLSLSDWRESTATGCWIGPNDAG